MATQLGYPHPDHLTAQLTASQLEEWKAYHAIEPWGEYRQELRHGRMMHLMHRAHFETDEDLRPVDFMAYTDQPEDDRAPEDPPEVLAARIAQEMFGM